MFDVFFMGVCCFLMFDGCSIFFCGCLMVSSWVFDAFVAAWCFVWVLDGLFMG